MDVQHKVEFTRAQLDWLDKSFPELMGNENTTDAALRWRSAQRSVIAAIKTRVQNKVGE